MAKDIKKDLAAARLDAENRMREVDFPGGYAEQRNDNRRVFFIGGQYTYD